MPRRSVGAVDTTTPRLAEWAHGAEAGPRIGGPIDGERMLWGDPLADFVSLALLGDIRRDADFLAGYQEAGGTVEFDGPARQRPALYRSYLYLIMPVETVPRASGDERVARVRETVGPQLTAALAELGPNGRDAADGGV